MIDMAHYNTILHQLLDLIPRHEFENFTSTHLTNRYVKKLTAWNQFTVLVYAQASGKNSLREIENSLLSQNSRLYHLGLPEKICRSTCNTPLFCQV